MKEELVSLETAKLARKKGFNLNSHAWYGCDEPASGGEGNQLFLRDHERWTNFGKEDSPQEGTMIYSAPTQTLLQRWLRDEHFIDIFIIDSIKEECYDWEIRIADVEMKIECDQYFYNYETALEAGLIKALKLL